jgi:hypothetical protein
LSFSLSLNLKKSHMKVYQELKLIISLFEYVN